MNKFIRITPPPRTGNHPSPLAGCDWTAAGVGLFGFWVGVAVLAFWENN